MSIIGIGIDLVETKRFSPLEISERALNRIFTQEEIAYCRSKSRPEQHFAARFAAKESVVKALAPAKIKLLVSDIEIVKAESGGVDVRFSQRSLALFADLGVPAPRMRLSVSHEKTHAVAMAVAEEIS